MVCTFSDVEKFDKKYVKKLRFCLGGAFAPPKQNLKRRAWDFCQGAFHPLPIFHYLRRFIYLLYKIWHTACFIRSVDSSIFQIIFWFRALYRSGGCSTSDPSEDQEAVALMRIGRNSRLQLKTTMNSLEIFRNIFVARIE